MLPMMGMASAITSTPQMAQSDPNKFAEYGRGTDISLNEN